MTEEQFKLFLQLWFDDDTNSHSVARDLAMENGFSATKLFKYAEEMGWWSRGYMTPGPVDKNTAIFELAVKNGCVPRWSQGFRYTTGGQNGGQRIEKKGWYCSWRCKGIHGSGQAPDSMLITLESAANKKNEED